MFCLTLAFTSLFILLLYRSFVTVCTFVVLASSHKSGHVSVVEMSFSTLGRG